MTARLGCAIVILVLLAAMVAVVPDSVYADQEAENPCYFCHVDLIFEMESGAHQKAGISCRKCHGESGGHVFAEDNSVKPDRVIEPREVGKFCGDCHEVEYQKYQSGPHGKEMNKEAVKTPTCVSCHSAHGDPGKQKILEGCFGCHGGKEDDRQDKSIPAIKSSEFSLLDYHSLQKKSK